MQPIEARRRSGSGAEAATEAASQQWIQEWRDAAAVERAEAVAAAQQRRDRMMVAAGIASVGAAVIHLSVAKMHLEEYTLFGVFFILSGIAQLVWPAWLLLRPWRPLLGLGAIGNALLVALWAVDRIWGLPIGPEHWKPESVGFGDAVTVGFELFVVGACLALLARGRSSGLGRAAVLGLALATVALTTLSLLSVLDVGSWLPPTD